MLSFVDPEPQSGGSTPAGSTVGESMSNALSFDRDNNVQAERYTADAAFQKVREAEQRTLVA